MNFEFRELYNGDVVETKWLGELTEDILAVGAKDRMSWIEETCVKKPLILLSDYEEANLEKITTSDIRKLASAFSGIDEKFPNIQWITIMSSTLNFGLARQWKVFSSEYMKDTHIVRDRASAEKLIDELLKRYGAKIN
jgi:hypothetical protein